MRLFRVAGLASFAVLADGFVAPRTVYFSRKDDTQQLKAVSRTHAFHSGHARAQRRFAAGPVPSYEVR